MSDFGRVFAFINLKTKGLIMKEYTKAKELLELLKQYLIIE